MSFNRLQKKILTIASNLGIICFSAIAASTATVAWFQFNQATASGLSIKCMTTDHNVNWDILKYDEETKEGVLVHNENEFYLPSYDQYITDKNIYSNVILKARILTPTGFYDDNQLYVDITCSGELLVGDEIIPVTSNLCEFKATVYSFITGDGEENIINKAIVGTNYDTMYKTASTFFNSTNSGSYSFVNVNANTPHKDRDKKITVIPRFNCGEEVVKEFVVFLECSYKPNLVDYYVQNVREHDNMGDLADREIQLNGDITEIEFRFGDKYSGSYVQVDDSTVLNEDDYVIAYDNYGVAFDGSGIKASDYNSGPNYIPVEINRGMIKNTETINKSNFSYTAEGNLRSHAGFNVGGTTANVESGMRVSQANDYANTLTHISGSNVDAQNGDKHLMYSPVEGNTNFNYYLYTNNAEADNVQFYKYSDDDSANLILESVRLSGDYPTDFILGEAFRHTGMVVTAQYVDPSGNRSTSIVTNSCAWTGYNMSAATRQVVTVSYTEDGVTASTTYDITITTGPTVTVSPTILIGVCGDIGEVSAYVTFFPDPSAVTYTWTVNDPEIIALDFSATGQRINFKYTKAGYATLTCTATDGVNTDSASINIRVTGEIADANTYVKITSSSQLEDGDYLIVWEKSNVEAVVFDGSLTTLDKGQNNYSTTIDNYEIAANETNNNSCFHFSQISGSTFKVQSNSGYYIGVTGTSNTIKSSTTYSDSYVNTISINFDGTASFKGSSAKYLRFNSTSGSSNYRFRYYDQNGQQPICLYKKMNTSTNLRLVNLAPNKIEYFKSEFLTRDEFEFGENALVMATFNNGSKRDVTASATVSGFNMAKAGTYTVTVAFEYGGHSESFTYQIRVTDPAVLSISLDTSEATLNFDKGDPFSPGGLRVIAYYVNETTLDVADQCTYSGYPDTPQTGQFTITVTYQTKTAQYTVNYNEPAEGWKLVTNQAALKTGDHVVIAAYDYPYAISKNQKANNRGQAAIVKTNDMMTFNTDVCVFDLTINDNGTYSFSDPALGYLCSASNSSNYLHSKETLDAAGMFNLTIGGTGIATIVSTGKYSRNTIRYNKGSSLFSCYSSGQADVCLYRYIGEYHEPVITPEEITVNYPSMELAVNGTGQIEATVKPANAANKVVHFSSSNNNIVTVSETGLVTGITPGSAFIDIVADADENVTARVHITVVIPHVYVTDVVIDTTTTTLNIGDELEMEAHVLPSNATDQGVYWESEDENIIKILHIHDETQDKDNVIKALASGVCTIYCYAADDVTIIDSIVIEVLGGTVVPVTGITLNPVSVSVEQQKTAKISYTVNPSGATNKTVSVESNNDSIATAQVTATGEITITGQGEGDAIITVKSNADATKKATCAVSVTIPEIPDDPLFEMATNLDNIENGAQIIIAGKDYNVAVGTLQNSSNRQAVDITKIGTNFNTISNASIGNNVAVFELVSITFNDVEYFGIKDINTGKYLENTATKTLHSVDENSLGKNSYWTIVIANDGNATLETPLGSAGNLQYNSSSSGTNPSGLFNTYTSTQKKIALFVNNGGTFSRPSSSMHRLYSQLFSDNKKDCILSPFLSHASELLYSNSPMMSYLKLDSIIISSERRILW